MRNKQYYTDLWNSIVINQQTLVQAKTIADKIKSNASQYESVSLVTKVPVNVIGLIHNMECGLSFHSHLHNGDPLTGKTIHYPAGRPTTGTAPFAWSDSAVDALRFDEFDKVTDWSIENTLKVLELYNCAGYSNLGFNSPYLWSGTNHYVSGKFIEVWNKDKGRYISTYDPTIISKQIGCAAILKQLQ